MFRPKSEIRRLNARRLSDLQLYLVGMPSVTQASDHITMRKQL